MPDASLTRRALRARRRRWWTKWWPWAIIGVAALALFAVAWLGIRGFQAKNELEAAQALIPTLKSQMVDLDVDAAKQTLAELSAHTTTAGALTGDPIWRLAEAVPAVGKNLTVVRQLTEVTNQVMAEVVQPLINVASTLDPASLTPKDGAIDVKPFVDAVPAVARAAAGVTEAERLLGQIDSDGTISQIVAAEGKISSALAEVAPAIELLSKVLPSLPPSFGADGPRNYVVAFQNTSESRALGGTALFFALVHVDNGKISLVETRQAGSSNFTIYPASVVPIPDGVDQLYNGSYGIFIPDATVRPSFTSAAEIIQEMWLKQFGYNVDGVFAVDTVAISYILRATDPIPLSTGDALGADNVSALLLNQTYQRYNSDDPVADADSQDALFSEAIQATFGRLSNGPLNPKVFIAALLQGWNENRILYASAHPDEQAAVTLLGVRGELPVSDDTTDRVGIYTQDNMGAKLNYYLTEAVRLSQGACRADGLESYRVSLDLTSSVPADASSLARSILGRYEMFGLDPGVQRLAVNLYAPPGSTITGIALNGSGLGVQPFHDTDYPVGHIVIDLPPGATYTVTYDVVAAQPGVKKLEAQYTPLVNPTVVSTEPLDCALVPAA